MLKVSLLKHRGNFTLAVDFEAATPGVTALFGRSGCGKSTITHLLAGLLAPDSGRIEIGSTVLFDSTTGINLPAEQRRIGYVFQDSRLFPHLTVEANLRYGLRRTRSDAGIRFDDAVALLGLQTLLTRRPAALSGGERQRVAVGRALLSQPRLLLLDEPLAALDAARRGELLPWLERLRDELALPMVYVSHQFDEVLRLADSMVLLEQGRVSDSGSVAAMSRTQPLRAIVGDETLGCVLEGVVDTVDATAGLARIRTGGGLLNVEADQLQHGQAVRVQLLARDLILATAAPHGLSVRNSLAGRILTLAPDGPRAWLAEVAVGGDRLLVRITDDARAALALAADVPVWVLVKAVSLRGYVFASRRPQPVRQRPGSATG